MKKLSTNFKLSLLHRVIVSFSGGLMFILFPWIVLTMTNSAFYTGFLVFLAELPLSVAFLVAHYISKIKKKKPLALGGASIKAIAIFSIFLAFLTGNRLYELIAIFIGFFVSAWASDVTRRIVNFWEKEFLDEEQYQRGSSLGQTFITIITLISYVAAGITISIGFNIGILIISIGYIISTVPLIFVKPRSDVKNIQHHSLREGLSFFWKTGELKYLVIGLLTSALAFGGSIIVLEALVKFRYDGSPLILTLFVVGDMGGGIAGAILASRVRGNIRSLFVLFSISEALLVVSIPFTTSYIFIIPILFFMEGISNVEDVLSHTAFLKIIPQDLRLQILGVIGTATVFPMVLSPLIFGAIIQFISLPMAFYVMAILVIPSTIVFWYAKELKGVRVGGSV